MDKPLKFTSIPDLKFTSTPDSVWQPIRTPRSVDPGFLTIAKGETMRTDYSNDFSRWFRDTFKTDIIPTERETLDHLTALYALKDQFYSFSKWMKERGLDRGRIPARFKSGSGYAHPDQKDLISWIRLCYHFYCKELEASRLWKPIPTFSLALDDLSHPS